MPDDIHRLLRQHDAPVIHVTDWRTGLDAVLGSLSIAQLQERQDRLADWYDGFLATLRNEVFCQIRAHMGR